MSQLTTSVIIQARMNSTRLPGKVLEVIEGKTVIERVIERAKRINGIDSVILAMPNGPESFPIASIAHGVGGICVFVGEEHDVLDRFYGAAKTFSADIIVRITADCPLIDPEVCEQVIALRKREGAHYASNVHPRSYPQGLDCEVFTFSALEKALSEAVDPYEREHVTPWIRSNYARVNLPSGRFDLAHHRWTLDYVEDLKFLRAIHCVREPHSMQDVLDILSDRKHLSKINAHCKQAA